MSDTIEEDERVDDASTAAADDDSAASGGGEDELLTLDAVRDELEMTLNNAKKHTRSKATHYKHARRREGQHSTSRQGQRRKWTSRWRWKRYRHCSEEGWCISRRCRVH